MVKKIPLNLNYYNGSDLYSDGNIEDELLNIVSSEKNLPDILANDYRWPLLYHLSPQRRNLLEWFDFRQGSSLLEVGAGCGALTGLFCEKVDRVVAVELSKRRAEIIAYRYKEKSNLEIVVGNLNDIQFLEKFDYVTLIGVLEYAEMFTNSKDPYLTFLIQVKRFLKPNGILIIAIENKFGLKYWAGASEDHSGQKFDGLEDYIRGNRVKTFGKDELTKLILEVGFSNLKYYYPMPDYKIPLQIFSDEYLPQIGQIEKPAPNYDRERLELFNEKLVYNNLIKNRKFDFFANSFLIICN